MTTPVSWLEQQYCRSVAAALMARTEFFELLEDATISTARLARARASWRRHTARVQTLKGIYAAA
jgi:tRNA A37 N6-isopentenylltransferase MiaA